MTRDEIKNMLLSIARTSAGQGPGWAQEGVVLREVSDQLIQKTGGLPPTTEQMILEVWHDLFAERVLAWGYDLDNPGSPFFHVRQPA